MLVLCPTPIGNLDDATPRQREVLASSDVIACEDSRTTGKLLELLGIDRSEGRPRFISYHDHNASQRVDELVAMLEEGQQVALVTDAGTPAISDPGYRLVRAAREAGVEVTVLPGPVAGAVAVAGSGLPTDRWLFEGFLPVKSGARQARLSAARETGATVVVYESPHRVVDLLDDIAAVYGEQHAVCVARELTKLHEEWLSGAVSDVVSRLRGRDRVKGEIVVCIGPPPAEEIESADAHDPWIQEMITAGIKPTVIKSVVSSVTGLSKSAVFDRMEQLKARL